MNSPHSSVGLASSAPSVSQPSSGSRSSTADTPYDLLTAAASTDLLPTRPSTDLPSSSRSSHGRAESREAFFTAELELEIKNEKQLEERLKLEAKKDDRVKRLVRAAQGFAEYREPPNAFYRDFWSVTSLIFDDSEAGSAPKGDFKAEAAYRLGRLKKARDRIPKKDEVTPRLCLVFLAHDVEHTSLQEGLQTSKGVGMMSAAIETAAKAPLGTPKEVQSDILKEVQLDRKRGRNYMALVGKGGPSSLLEVGNRVSAM